jgi:hypothetical protein
MKNLPTYTEAVDAEALALARASDPSARCHDQRPRRKTHQRPRLRGL